MMPLAVGTGSAIVASIGLLVGVVVLGTVVSLFYRVVRPTLEIRRYSEEILEAGLAIARNLDGVDELERTRQLGGAIPDLVRTNLGRLQRHRA